MKSNTSDIIDFALSTDGEISINNDTHDIEVVSGNNLKVQLAYNRIKSVSTTWFIDKIGANLEEIVGRPCSVSVVKYGKEKIYDQLTYDGLWSRNDIHIQGHIINNTNVVYAIFLRVYDIDAIKESYVYEITAELDLVKGVFIKFGWNPRRLSWTDIQTEVYKI